MTYCSKCGADLLEEADFCIKCGARLSEKGRTEAEAIATKAMIEGHKAMSRIRSWKTWALYFIILGIGISIVTPQRILELIFELPAETVGDVTSMIVGPILVVVGIALRIAGYHYAKKVENGENPQWLESGIMAKGFGLKSFTSNFRSSESETESAPVSSSPRRRPSGIIILAILSIIGGILALFAGAGLLFVVVLAGGFTSVDIVYLAVFGCIVLVYGIISIPLAWGYLEGRGWAWSLGIMAQITVITLNILSVIDKNKDRPEQVSAVGDAVLPIVFGVIILVYLSRSHVKDYFGK